MPPTRLLAALSLAALAGCDDAATPSPDATVAAVDVPAVDVTADAVPSCPPPLGAARPRSGPRPAAHPMDDVLRLNHLQAKGTHNSYHLRPPRSVPDWDYDHAPLGEQLERQGVRKVELDVHWSARCERYEVRHLPLLDPLTTCAYLTDCLEALRAWSDAHPAHHALFVQIEPKDPYEPAVAEARMAALEREVLAVWPRELVIAPDDVRGDAPTLAAAVATRGWPTLAATRGRVLFFVDRADGLRDVYTRDRTSLDGRLLFIEGGERDPWAAVRIINDPVRDRAAIERAVRAGAIVRTRADSAPSTAQAEGPAALAAALASGAQIISTDYPAPVAGRSYHAAIPEGTPSRCNPLTAPAGCTPRAIEDPARLAP